MAAVPRTAMLYPRFGDVLHYAEKTDGRGKAPTRALSLSLSLSLAMCSGARPPILYAKSPPPLIYRREREEDARKTESERRERAKKGSTRASGMGGGSERNFMIAADAPLSRAMCVLCICAGMRELYMRARKVTSRERALHFYPLAVLS